MLEKTEYLRTIVAENPTLTQNIRITLNKTECLRTKVAEKPTLTQNIRIEKVLRWRKLNI